MDTSVFSIQCVYVINTVDSRYDYVEYYLILPKRRKNLTHVLYRTDDIMGDLWNLCVKKYLQ